MSLKVSSLVKDMLAAAKTEVADKWPDVKIYATAEARKLAQTLVMIQQLRLAGQITQKQAEILLDMQKQTSRVVLLTIEGLSLLAAEAAVNAAVKAIRDTVNDAVGWRLV